MTDTLVILNPRAGGLDTLRDWQDRVESVVGTWPIRVTSQAGEAEKLTRRAIQNGFKRIVAAGGDGTVNEVVNGIDGSNAVLGILPIGTVNVFAMELGLPSNDLRLCRDMIEAGNIRLVDYRVPMENTLSN